MVIDIFPLCSTALSTAQYPGKSYRSGFILGMFYLPPDRNLRVLAKCVEGVHASMYLQKYPRSLSFKDSVCLKYNS